MKLLRTILFFLAMGHATGLFCAQTPDTHWYRRSYGEMGDNRSEATGIDLRESSAIRWSKTVEYLQDFKVANGKVLMGLQSLSLATGETLSNWTVSLPTMIQDHHIGVQFYDGDGWLSSDGNIVSQSVGVHVSKDYDEHMVGDGSDHRENDPPWTGLRNFFRCKFPEGVDLMEAA